MSKRRLKQLLIAMSLLLPCSGIAFFDFGSSTFLPQILAELIEQTYVLFDQLTNLQTINDIRRDIRHGVYDILDIEVPILEEREFTIGDMYETANNPAGVAKDLFILGRTQSVDVINEQVKDLYGRIPKSNGRLFDIRDEQAIYSISHASLISEEALSFSDTGRALLDDLDGAAEGKATVRGAQAEAIQVQQLANIEANQGLMISLQAQQVLGTNEVGKSLTDVSDHYLDMLGSALAKVAEEEE